MQFGNVIKFTSFGESTFSPYTSGYGRMFITRLPRIDCSSPWYDLYEPIPPSQWYQLYRSQERSKILHDGFNKKVSELLSPKIPSIIDDLEIYRGSELKYQSFNVRPLLPFDPFIV